MSHMMEIAEYLGKTEDIPLYKEYRDGCREAYRELVHLPFYSLDTDRQAKLVRPLYMHLLDEKDEKYELYVRGRNQIQPHNISYDLLCEIIKKVCPEKPFYKENLLQDFIGNGY